MNYITTNPDSELPLEQGRSYFMDFEISGQNELSKYLPLESVGIRLQNDLKARGHVIKNVKTEWIDNPWPDPNIVRVSFTVDNALHILIIVAVAVAIIVLSAGVSGGAFVLFKGLGEIPAQVSKVPAAVLKSAMDNPIAVIAIMIAVSLFILGRKF